jgi:hypothetical protein
MSKFSESQLDDRANELNPAHPAFYLAQGACPDEAQRKARQRKLALDNLGNQLNPEHPLFYLSRGLDPEEAERKAAEHRRRSGVQQRPLEESPSSNLSSAKPE